MCPALGGVKGVRLWMWQVPRTGTGSQVPDRPAPSTAAPRSRPWGSPSGPGSRLRGSFGVRGATLPSSCNTLSLASLPSALRPGLRAWAATACGLRWVSGDRLVPAGAPFPLAVAEDAWLSGLSLWAFPSPSGPGPFLSPGCTWLVYFAGPGSLTLNSGWGGWEIQGRTETAGEERDTVPQSRQAVRHTESPPELGQIRTVDNQGGRESSRDGAGLHPS